MSDTKLTAAWRDATCETTTFLLWKSAVIGAAAKRGASAEFTQTQAERLALWFRTGEPVWMAADSLLNFWRGAQLADRADAEVEGLRRAVRRGLGRQ